MSGERPAEASVPEGRETLITATSAPANGVLGHPRLHLRHTDSTNERARALATAGAPHGALVTASEQTAGRGRQGRTWSAPAGSSLLCSLVLRCEPPAPLSLIAAVAVCDAIGEHARVKWPNDVVIERAPTDALRVEESAESPAQASTRRPTLAKLAGILIEGRPQERWAVLGIGVNVAVRVEELPAEVRERAASLELPSSAIEPLLEDLLSALARRLSEPAPTLLEAWRARDALRGREIFWGAPGPGSAHDPHAQPGHPGSLPVRHGHVEGIDGEGRLLVRVADSQELAVLSAGEVHLRREDQSD